MLHPSRFNGIVEASGTARQILPIDLWGQAVGYWNISRNSDGMMGYQTPNGDRIAEEGVKFTDWYGQQSCTPVLQLP